jgi:hypothetical protein
MSAAAAPSAVPNEATVGTHERDARPRLRRRAAGLKAPTGAAMFFDDPGAGPAGAGAIGGEVSGTDCDDACGFARSAGTLRACVT